MALKINGTTVINDSRTLENIVDGTLSGNLAITANTASTSTTSGALTIAGGMAVAGNLYVGKIYGDGSALTGVAAGTATTAATADVVSNAAQPNITSLGTLTALTVSGNSNLAILNANSQVTFSGNIASTSTGTGTVIISGTQGGLGVAGNVYANAYYGDGSNLTGVGFSGGTVANATTFTANVSSTSGSTGSVIISGANGGLGVQGNVRVGNNLHINGNGENDHRFWIGAPTVEGANIFTLKTSSIDSNWEMKVTAHNTATGQVARLGVVRGGLGSTGAIDFKPTTAANASTSVPSGYLSFLASGSADVFWIGNPSGQLQVSARGALASTSSNTGSLIITSNGGLGVEGNINVDGTVNKFGGGTDSTSTTSGVVQVTGGVGVSGNIYAARFFGNGAGLTGITASSATTATSAGSATTAATVTANAQPNITSVGTLTSLTVTGNVSAGNVSGTLLTGTLATAAQPNVTSVGTLTSLAVTGNITSGNVSGTRGAFTNLAGTLETAAQPNITSTGTLTALTVSGTSNLAVLNANGQVTFSGNISSISTGSGTVVISGTQGGLGVGGNAWVGGDMRVSGTITGILGGSSAPQSASVSTLNATSDVSFTSNLDSTSTTTGAVTLPNGGMGVAGNVHAARFFGNGAGLTGVTATSSGSATTATTAATVTTNAQPNITSVGTLSSLSVSYNSSSGAPRIAGTTSGRLDLEDLDQADASRPFQYLSSEGGSLVIGNANRSGNSTTGSAERMRIDSSGNVAIGVTSASGILHVRGNNVYLDKSGTDEPTIRFRSANDTYATQWALGHLASSNNFGLRYYNGSAWSGVATIDTSGNVGIGTASPAQRLHVENTAGAAGSAVMRLATSGTVSLETGLEFFSPMTDTTAAHRAGRIYSVGDGASFTTQRLSFQSMTTGNTLVDTLHLKNGSVGIGTTSPSSALHVVGNITAGNLTGATLVSATNLTGTLTTAAQTNITSVGTLTSLGVTGNITAGNANITGTTASASTTTGALVVAGGVGIGGNAFVGGNVTVTGNLTVNGTTTTINSTVVTVDDIVLELGDVTTPTDTTANSGGILLKGATNKTITWVQSTGRWTSNQGFEATSIQNTPIGNGTASSGAFTTLTSSGATTFTAGTSSTSTTTGTVVVTGGVGVSDRVTANQLSSSTLDVSGNVSLVNAGGTASYVTILSNASSTSTATGSLLVGGGAAGSVAGLGVAGNINAGGTAIRFTGGTASANITSGTVVVTGGMGVSGNINAGNVIATNFTGLASTATAAGTAATVTGTTQGNITSAPNLTTVGTLSSLTVSGNVSAGNVGIGVATPLTRLHVQGTGTSTGVTLTLANGGEIGALNDPLGKIDFYSNDGSTSASGVKGSLGVYNEFNGNWDGNTAKHITYMSFATSNNSVLTERMRINSLGNVGIGTTSPSSALHVVGNITAGNLTGATLVSATNLTGTLTTAAQTNITSVGTLTSLTVSGATTFTAGTASANITSGTVVVTGGMGVSGNINAGNVIATNFTGLASTATAAGSATTAATVTASSQPSITSVGTLTSLTVSGNGNLGNLTLSNVSNNAVTATLTSGGSDTLFKLTAQNGPGGNDAGTEMSRFGLRYSGSWDSFTQYVRGSAAQNGWQVLWAGNTAVANVTSSGVNVVATTASTSTTTGALIVAGGIGVGGNVYAGAFYGAATGLTAIPGANVTGTVSSATSATTATSATSATTAATVTGTTQGNITSAPNLTSVGTLTSLTSSGDIVTSATTAATSTTTGAFRSSGGAGIGGNLFVGGIVDITSTAASTGTTTGAFILDGGAGIAGNINVGGASSIFSGNTASISVGTGTVIIGSGVGSVAGLSVAGNINAGGTAIRFTGNTASTSTTTGTVVITGGMGVSGNVFVGGTNTATYADLAEKYVADAAYEPGTVLAFGGDYEVTLAAEETIRVAGVVSTNPAYLMNQGAAGEHVAAVAFTGRVPTKVRGTVRKGDMMVSAGGGYARATIEPKFGAVIGKALQDFDGEEGVIEVVVGRY